jgi:LPS export ABC transporter permease LptF/LPS export ABC transporter permease LptG
MRLISRNILREILPPFGLALAAYTFLLILKSLLTLSEVMVRRGLSVGTVATLLFLTLPHVVVLTIPMAFLFGILIGVGRMSGDSEIIALRACGTSRAALLAPVLAAGVILFALELALTIWGYPAANAELEKRQTELFASAAVEQVRPRVFTEIPGERTLFVDRLTPDQTGYQGVFLDDRSSPGRETVIVARDGRFRLEPGRLWLDLRGAISHSGDPATPQLYRQNESLMQSILLRETPAGNSPNATSQKGMRQQTLAELLATARRTQATEPAQNRTAWVEIQKKFAIPAACIVFAFVGLPLGVTNRRGGKGSGFAVSIAVILGYYLLLNNGETWAEEGRLSPALAMWLPNAVLFAIGAALLMRRDQERRSWLERLKQWRALRSAAGQDAAPVVRAPRRAWLSGLTRFPAGLDRYVLSPFLAALAAIYVSVGCLYVIVDYSDHVDDIVKRHIPASTVGAYYRALLAPIGVQILPFCLLIAALLALGGLSRRNEDTAFKACGVPVWRLGAGILATALLASAALFWVSEYVLPQANRESHRLLARIKGRTERPASGGESGIWVVGDGNRVWNFDSYDPARQIVWRPALFELDPGFARVTRRIAAADAAWDGHEWVFENGWERRFDGVRETSFGAFGSLPSGCAEKPRLFSQQKQAPDEMRYRALARYIDRLGKSGYPVAALQTALAAKPAAAAQAFILACLAIPFAFSIGKKGTLTGIGVGLAAGMAFLVLAAFATKLGEVGSLPPNLAAWSPNLVFLLFAGYRLTRTRT